MNQFSQIFSAGLLSAFVGVAAMSGTPKAHTPPPPGSEQDELLAPHKDFVIQMRNCCNLRDGRGNVAQRHNEGDDKAAFPYIVTITQDLAGKPLKEPFELKIPKGAVVDLAEARAKCKAHRLVNPDSTCIPPSFSVLWAFDNSDTEPYQTGEQPFRITTLYCFYPAPDLQ